MDESYSFVLELKYKVEIVNHPPIVLINLDKTSGSAPLTILFSSDFLDYDGFIKTYHWDFGDGNTSDLQNPTHTYPNIGTYTIKLIVTDDYGATGEDSVIITVI